MIFGTPVSWLVTEIFAFVLAFVVIVHATKQEKPAIRILEFIGLCIAAGLYENGGVASNIYNYDLHRLIMVGKVPLEIMVIEGAIWYFAFMLAQKMKMPKWTLPLLVGLFAAVQDMTIDPSAVFDMYEFNGVLSGQWNWTMHYDGGFFGIPFFNFSGWFYMMAYYTAFVQIGRWLHDKTKNIVVGYAYPIVGAILTPLVIGSPLNIFLLWGYPLFPMNAQYTELLMLVINFLIPIILMFVYRDRIAGIDMKKDKIVFIIPIVLHVYDIIYAFALQTEQAYIPSLVITGIHLLFFYYLKRKSETKSEQLEHSS